MRSTRINFFSVSARIVAGVVLWLGLSPAGRGAEDLPPLPKGPLFLTSVTAEQLDANYWIRKLPDPDRLIKTPEQLEKFNREIHDMIVERKDIFRLDEKISGSAIREVITTAFEALRGRGLFDVNDQVVSRAHFDKEIKPRLNLDAIGKSVSVRWGAAVRATSVRALPTSENMLQEKGDIEFDQLQFSLIKSWTPVAIYQASDDGLWYFVQAPYVRGWVRSRDIAVFSDRAQLKQYAKAKSFLVITGESASIFKDPERTQTEQRVTMGTVIPIAGKNTTAYEVWMPYRGDGGKVTIGKRYVSFKSDTREGFLPYTQRNVIRQAFKLLGVRYGWGGMYNGRDCSGFIHDVFLSVGVDMPRDSRQQGVIGTQIGNFEPFVDQEMKRRALRSARPGITLLTKPLHVMLYLGEDRGQFYIIHSTWAERYSMTSDAKNRINQVVVSDLTLNGRSHTGSLFDRMISANEIN
ncbi:MAG: SH3 domain-containing protein [Candidatus Omnitrophota bacterium]